MTHQSLEEIHRTVASFEGWLSPAEGAFLYETAKKCAPQGAVIEVGSWQGKSTTYLAFGLKSSGAAGKVHAIDPHTGAPEHAVICNNPNIWTFDSFEKNIEAAGVADAVEPVVDRSERVAAAWRAPVSFAWIDGAHAYEAAKLDFDSWFPHLKEGGVMAYHDSTFQDVRKVVRKYMLLSRHFKNAGVADSITYATKVDPSRQTFFDRLRNYSVYAFSGLYRLRAIPLPGGIKRPVKAAFKRCMNKVLRAS